MTTRKPSQRYFRALALEPRILLDAAAVATANAVAKTVIAEAQDDSSTNASDVQNTKNTSLLNSLRTANEDITQATDSSLQPSLGSTDNQLAYLDVVQLLASDDEYSDNDLVGIQDVTVIGDKVYALRSDSPWNDETYENEPVNILYVFQRTDSGSLVLVDSKDISGISDAARIRTSSDGEILYIIGADGIALFNAGTQVQIGSISFADPDATETDDSDDGLGDDTASPGLVNDVLAKGDFVYVSLGDSVRVYSRDGSVLALVQTLADIEQVGGANALALSPDGNTLFVATSGGQTLVSLFSVGADGKLAFQNSVAGFGEGDDGYFYGSNLSLSPDGKSLYVIDNNSALHTLTKDSNGDWAATGLIDLSTSADDISVKDVIISPDGSMVLVTGNFGYSADYNVVGMLLYVRDADGNLTLQKAIEGFGDISYDGDGIKFSEVRHASFSADGSQLYLAGKFNYGRPEGILVLEMKPAGATFVEGEGAVALLPSGTLSNPHQENQDNYGGSSLVIERQGGAQAGDTFTLLGSNDLTLRDGQIWDGTTALADFVVDTSGKLTVTFLAGVSAADAQRVLRNIAYDSSSKDPAATGTTAHFQIVFNDGNGHSDTLNTDVSIEGRNDPAIVSTEAQTPTFTAGNDLVTLFKNTQIDTVESGQPIWKVIVSIDGAADGDILGVDGERITNLGSRIGQGIQTLESGRQYIVMRDDGGKIVVHLFVKIGEGEAGAKQAQTLIDSLSFGSASEAPSGTRTIGLQVYETVDVNHPEPKNAVSTFDQQAVVRIRTSAPELSATGTTEAIRVGSDHAHLPGDVDLFDNVEIYPGLTDQTLDTLVITVNRYGANQALVIGGTAIALSEASGEGDGYTYSVTVEGNTTRITLTFTEQSASEVGALIGGASYRVLDSKVAAGNVVVTLKEVRNSADKVSTPNIVATVNVAGNAAPQANPDNFTAGEAKAGQPYSLQLPANLFSDADGDSLTWTLDGLPAGLTFDPNSRTISGTTLVMGEHALTIKVSDGWGGEAEIALTLDVLNSEPVANSQYSLGHANADQDYKVVLPQNLFTDANDSDLTWDVSNLPEWLSYDPDTRTLSGTAPPQAGSYAITITASDVHGGSATLTLTLSVISPTSVTELHSATQQPSRMPATDSFGGPALNAPLFESSDELLGDNAQAPASAQPAPASLGLLRSSTGSGLADGRGSLSEQLANADRVLTDSGYQDARGSFSFDGSTLRSSVDLSQGTARSISLQLRVEPGTRITQSNGMPLPSGVRFDSRTGELHIDRERLQRDGVLRLTLFNRDAEGKEQRTPLEISAEGAPARNASETPQAPAAQVESLPERMRQDTSSALLSEALDLLDQLSDLAGEPVVISTRHSA